MYCDNEIVGYERLVIVDAGASALLDDRAL